MTTTASTPKSNTDFVLLGVALILTCLGILLIFDASYGYAVEKGVSAFKFVRQQSLFAIIGVALMLYVANTPYTKLRKLAMGLMGASFVGLLMVFVPHLGIAKNGAHRWIGHGTFAFQPSELAKLAVVIYVANNCAGRLRIMGNFWDGPFPPLVAVAVLGLLTEREPDLGTALVILSTGLAALFFSGMRVRHLVACVLVGAVLLTGLVFLKHKPHSSAAGLRAVAGSNVGSPETGYRADRFGTFLDPEGATQGAAYQVYHGLIALGSGGVFGMGIGTGREKLYLPESYTDFIFAVLGEETGLIGSLFVVALYILLVGRGIHIAGRTKDPFGAILAATISAAFGIQALLNLAVVTSSIPATGVPLPFLSYGGSSLVLSLVFVGMLLSINKFSESVVAERRIPTRTSAERDFDRRWDRGATLSRPEYRRDVSVGPARTRTRRASMR